MAKGEGRGFKKWLPSKYTIAKVFFALVAIKIVSQFAYKYVPPTAAPFLPNLA
jgi:hypothetical protein